MSLSAVLMRLEMTLAVGDRENNKKRATWLRRYDGQ